MTRIPALTAINEAESRLVQSRRNLGQGMDRTRANLRAVMARPSTLVLVAVASGISAFLVSHRPRPGIKSAPKNAASNFGALSRSLIRTLVSMYGARVLTLALQLGATAEKHGGSRANVNMSGS